MNKKQKKYLIIFLLSSVANTGFAAENPGSFFAAENPASIEYLDQKVQVLSDSD